MSASLFDPVRLGALELANRLVMAPMTRSRAGGGDAPTAMNVDYYRQRASAGLIITEGVQPSANGKGYCRSPGLYSAAQVAGWRAVTAAVHAEGGRIVAQIMHCGRIGSHHNKEPGTETVGGTNALWFSAGSDGGTHGLLGLIRPSGAATSNSPTTGGASPTPSSSHPSSHNNNSNSNSSNNSGY